MVHETYDNIVAILLVGLIFVGAVLLMPALSFSNIQSVDYQQLRNTAVNVFDSILLSPGDPIDWGSTQDFSVETVNAFGLAKYQNSHFYILDPDKVQRLKSGNPLGEITNEEAKELLNLNGYGFTLRIIPPFNVTNIDGSKITTENSPINANLLNEKQCYYDVKVSFLDGRPIAYADVQSLVVYSNGSSFAQAGPLVEETNSLGICTGNTPLDFVPTQVIVILTIDVAEVATLVVTFGSEMPNVVDINMVGDDIILTKPDNNPTGATIFLNGLYVFKDDKTATLFEDFKSKEKFTYTQSGNYQKWIGNFPGVKYYEPSLVILCYDDTEGAGGRQDFVVAGPYQNLLGYSIFEYGSSPKISDNVIRIQRSVLISGMTYTAELVFWKER